MVNKKILIVPGKVGISQDFQEKDKRDLEEIGLSSFW